MQSGQGLLHLRLDLMTYNTDPDKQECGLRALRSAQ
jgi:hypothetical protein